MPALYRNVCAHGELKTFKAKLLKRVNGYLSLDESIDEELLLEAMGFPPNGR